MRASEAKIAVYGAGAMGTVLGAFLTLGGLKNVALITRNRLHVENLKRNGAVINCIADGVVLKTAVTALLPEEMEKYDVVFLMTKQRKNAEIVELLRSHLTEEGIICTTQNGLPEREIAEIIGKNRTYGGVCTFGAEKGEGEVKMTSKRAGMKMEIGGYENGGEKLPLLKEILSFAGKTAGVPFVNATGDLAGARWTKLAINAAFSSLSVVTGLSFGEIAKRKKTRKIALGILRETFSVAAAAGVTLDTSQGRKIEKYLGGKSPIRRFVAYVVLPFAMRKHKNLRSGMLKDVEEGRRCEIDFIAGAVVKEGARVGVETPLLAQTTDIVHGIENGLYEIGYENADFYEI